jgi:hypothetical protein
MGCLRLFRHFVGGALVAGVFAGYLPGLLAQDKSSESSSKPSSHALVLSDVGSLSEGVYRNTSFGFSYKVPFGWVDRTDVMRDSPAESSKGDSAKAEVLLAVFERPPEAGSDTPNSAVIIAAESVSSYPGLKSAGDYFGPLTEVTKRGGFKAVGGPYEFSVGGRPVVRGDFSKEENPPAMRQSSLVMLAKGCVVSFTFISTDEGEVGKLIEGLSLVSSISGRKSATPAAPPKK